MRFRVTPALAEHARQIAEVHVGSWRSTYRGIVSESKLAELDPEARARFWSGILAEGPAKTCTFVAIDDTDQVLGFANGGPVRGDELQADAELYAIYLLQQAQRQGVGSALFSAVARFLSNSGFNSMGVWVLERNPCRGFYPALGGELVATKQITIGDRALTEVGYRWLSLPAFLKQ